jgi:hypothetical protein
MHRVTDGIGALVEDAFENGWRQAVKRFGVEMTVADMHAMREGRMKARAAALGRLGVPAELGATCDAVLYHGPGHQSRAVCDQRGPHEQHSAIVLNQRVGWHGDESTEMEEVD